MLCLFALYSLAIWGHFEINHWYCLCIIMTVKYLIILRHCIFVGLLSGDSEKTDSEHPQCAQYKEELEHVKEEFERYKLRAQSVLKNKNKVSYLHQFSCFLVQIDQG